MSKEEYINLFHEYYHWVIKDCQNSPAISKEDAEDIAMQLFMYIWNNLPNINKSTVKTFLIRSARNKCIDYLRRNKQFQLYIKNNNTTNQAQDELKSIEKRNLLSRIRSVIETLPPKQQEIIKLTYLHGNTREEVSSKLNTNPITVRNGLHQGMNNLRKELLKHKITK